MTPINKNQRLSAFIRVLIHRRMKSRILELTSKAKIGVKWRTFFNHAETL